MVVFVALIVPIPFKAKRALFTFISDSPLVAKLQYGMKVCTSPSTRPASRRPLTRCR